MCSCVHKIHRNIFIYNTERLYVPHKKVGRSEKITMLLSPGEINVFIYSSLFFFVLVLIRLS